MIDNLAAQVCRAGMLIADVCEKEKVDPRILPIVFAEMMCLHGIYYKWSLEEMDKYSESLVIHYEEELKAKETKSDSMDI